MRTAGHVAYKLFASAIRSCCARLRALADLTADSAKEDSRPNANRHPKIVPQADNMPELAASSGKIRDGRIPRSIDTPVIGRNACSRSIDALVLSHQSSIPAREARKRRLGECQAGTWISTRRNRGLQHSLGGPV